ncbi:YhbD family protein [Cohnella laeviribosi]|uniref:YhbD family protein n=1 Tax=Cohnella laeviribosi TaxID=380174 RepID=UPI003D1E618A
MSGQELISKKELLELTGISYGQLYRWKRKQLIPEDWFIRKSTFTGQETFFPRELILSRIDKIINMKEDLSLDELADKLSPYSYDLNLRKDEIMKRNIVSSVVMERFAARDPANTVYAFEQILFLYVADRLLQDGAMNLDEGELLLSVLKEHFPKFEGKACELIFIRKMGVPVFALVSMPAELHFESGAKVVARVPLAECAERLKLMLT